MRWPLLVIGALCWGLTLDAAAAVCAPGQMPFASRVWPDYPGYGEGYDPEAACKALGADIAANHMGFYPRYDHVEFYRIAQSPPYNECRILGPLAGEFIDQFEILNPCTYTGGSSSGGGTATVPEAIMACTGNCTATFTVAAQTVTHVIDVQLPVLSLTTEQGGLIAGAILAVWVVGFGIRAVIRTLNSDGESTSESEKDS